MRGGLRWVILTMDGLFGKTQKDNQLIFIGNNSVFFLCIFVDKNMQTSIKDVYACGDVILKEVYQLVTASSEGAIVATSIIKDSQGR